MRKVILFLASNPVDTEVLPELWKEITEVKREIRHSKHGKKFDFHHVPAASPKDLRIEMVELRPQIVHFSGHGAGADGIVLTSDSGESNFVTGDILQDFFRQFDCVECIVLNACYSIEQAEPLSQCVRYVIGIHNEVDDESARDFSASFYSALGNGYSIEAAFEMSRSYLDMKNKPIEFSPQLIKRDVGVSQQDAGGSESPLSVLDPLKDIIRPFLNLAAGSRTQLSSLSLEARKDINSLLYQWIAVSTIALLLAAGMSIGPAGNLVDTFRMIALVAMPLLQWFTIRHWMRGAPWWSWFLVTTGGWLCGWLISDYVFFGGLFTGADYYSQSPGMYGADEFGYDDDLIIRIVLSLVFSLTVTGAVVGLAQGFLLRRSFLRVHPLRWMFASTLGMFLGALIGIPFIFLYSVIINTSPDDFMFSLILGLTYGTMTGRVLLPHIDRSPKQSQTASQREPPDEDRGLQETRNLMTTSSISDDIGSAPQTSGREMESNGLPATQSFASRLWLSVQRLKITGNFANWALLCAILALLFLLVDPDMPLTVLTALAATLLGYRAILEVSELEGHQKGRRQAIASLLIGLSVLAIAVFSWFFIR